MSRWPIPLFMMLSLALAVGCRESPEPRPFDVSHADVVTVDVSDDIEEGDSDGDDGCLDRFDCGDDRVCFEGFCVRPDDLPPCEAHRDCPDDFICVDEICEED